MSRRHRSEAWDEIQPAMLSREDDERLSAQAERRAARKARPDRRNEAVPVQVNLVEWMRTGFFTCSQCVRHWQPDQVAPGGEYEEPVARAGEPMDCPFCGASRWKVKWTAGLPS